MRIKFEMASLKLYLNEKLSKNLYETSLIPCVVFEMIFALTRRLYYSAIPRRSPDEMLCVYIQ